MKQFDENLSPHLVTKLADHYPGSAHAESVSNAFVGAALAAKTGKWCLSQLTGATPFDLFQIVGFLLLWMEVDHEKP